MNKSKETPKFQQHTQVTSTSPDMVWVCYPFGSVALPPKKSPPPQWAVADSTEPQFVGIRWEPSPETVPNKFVRWMMKVCFACTWQREESTNNKMTINSMVPKGEGE